jgi:hypothetical protein
MYEEIILDIICTDNFVIIYYKDTPAYGKISLEDDIKAHFPD